MPDKKIIIIVAVVIVLVLVLVFFMMSKSSSSGSLGVLGSSTDKWWNMNYRSNFGPPHNPADIIHFKKNGNIINIKVRDEEYNVPLEGDRIKIPAWGNYPIVNHYNGSMTQIDLSGKKVNTLVAVN